MTRAITALALLFTLASPANAARYVNLFTIPNCAACPASKALAAQHGIRVVDASLDPQWARLCGVRVYPTWIAEEDGRIVDRHEGTPTVERLRQLMGAGDPRRPRTISPDDRPQPTPAGPYGTIPGTSPDLSPWRPATPSDRPSFRQTTVQITCGRAGGSGAIVGSHEGIALVLTAHHVIEDGGSLSIQTSDGTRHPAEIFASSEALDLAALKVTPGYDLPAAPLSSEEPQQGESVTMCGFGGGRWRELQGKVTGYYGRGGHRNAIDLGTDAISIPGDSGGPIYNARGEVVAILWGGPLVGPRGPMIRTQAVRQEQINAFFEQRTNVLAEVFGPHSQVRKNEAAIAALEARMQSMGYTGSEIAQLKADIARLQDSDARNTQLADTARRMYAEWEPIRADVIALVRNGLAPERQAILDQAASNAASIISTHREADKALIAAAEQRARKAEEEAAAAKTLANGATAKAEAANATAEAAKASVLETVANAFTRYKTEREAGATPAQAGLAAAGQALTDRERDREAAIIGAIQAGLEKKEEGAGGFTIAQTVLAALTGGSIVGVGLAALRKVNPPVGYAATAAVTAARALRKTTTHPDGTQTVEETTPA